MPKGKYSHKRRHGFAQLKNGKRHSFYQKWIGIKIRLYASGTPSYKYYGGKGIKTTWDNFLDFYNDMYKSYVDHVKRFGKKNTTIERIDNNKDYCKENCQWATWEEQRKNQGQFVHERKLFFNGKKQSITAWSKELGINRRVLYARLGRFRWSIEKTLSCKVRTQKNNTR